MTKLPTVFLDRDGVINEDRDDYVKNVQELRVFSYTPDAIRRLNDAGYQVIVVSNQQAVAKGIISEETLMDMQREIERQVESAGGRIAAFYYCRHFAADNCGCRKPKPGMLTQAGSDHNVDFSRSFMVGDNEKDAQAGSAAGCKTIIVLTGMATRESIKTMSNQPDFVASNLSDAVDIIVGG